MPIMATSFIQMAYSLTDMAWVGRLGSEAVAAVGAVGILTWMSGSIALLNKVGSEVSVAQSIGAQNRDDARAFASHNISIALLIAICWGGLLFVFARPIMSLFELEAHITDNAVTYLTPKFGGLDAVFQYSFGADTQSDAYKDGTEGKSSVERMYAGAVRYQNSTVLVSAGVEGINQDQPSADRNGLDDALSFNLGGSYDAGFAKFYVYSQVFQNYAKAAKVTMFSIPSGVDGYGVNLGFETKALGGTVKASFGWGDFEGSHADNLTMKTYQTALGYNYPLSRRTTLYTAAGWIHNDFSDDYAAAKPTAVENDYEWICGITHKF